MVWPGWKNILNRVKLLKVFFDTNILLDVAIRANKYPHSLKLVNDLLTWPEASCWISALSINNIEYILAKMGRPDKAQRLLEFIRQRFSIVPVRRSSFRKAFDFTAGDFEDAVQAQSAAELGMEFIITRNPADFKQSQVPVLAPIDFLTKWNSGELTKVRKVPFLDLKAQHHLIYNDIDDRLTGIIADTGFIQGRHVKEFEERFAALQGAKYCIGVSSGTAALHAALLALGIRPGDRVIVPVNTFIATAEAVSLCGAEPVFVDCDQYYNIDPDRLHTTLSAMDPVQRAAVKAVIPVHLYGRPVDMDRVTALAGEFGLAVVEDGCQAHLASWQGTRVGTFGQFGAFSFYPGKNLGAYGEAGALVTNDPGLYEKARSIRQHGEIKRYHHQVAGHNYRMEEIQGAVLAIKCKPLTEWTRQRQENAKLYDELLPAVPGVVTPKSREGCESVYHLYVIEVDERDGLRQYLQEQGIATGIHYPIPLHLQQAYQSLGYKEGDFPMAEQAASRILSLPMFPELSEEQIRYVAEKIKDFFN